ncbi:MAG TPA: hypothetical protein VGZ27_12035 [Vicinamibacterales bacterium]|jgi:hypothetical protein|nr:hypothetical protein [Vicinamibacterales bacterium]
MTKKRVVFLFILVAIGAILAGRSLAQEPVHQHGQMAHEAGPATSEEEAAQSMSAEHLHMGSHMKMTAQRPATAQELQRAAEIVSTLRPMLEKYKDYHAALADGYRPFLENIPQPQYHFTNYWHGFEAAFRFNPAEPTSLLYKKTADGYQLLGAMYTAPKRMTEEQLNERIPLSVGRWHAHINICLPPAGQRLAADWTTFGFAGSIATRDTCEKAGGRFEPQIFGWMVHVYPFETTTDQIWRH